MNSKKKKPYIKPVITLNCVVIEEHLAATSQIAIEEIKIVGPNDENVPHHSWDETAGQNQQFNW